MNFRIPSRLSSRRGLTLLEAALALAIFGIILGAVWVASSTVIFNQSVNGLEQGIINTSSRIREYFRDRPISTDTGAVTNANMLSLNLVAPELIVNGAIIHKLGVDGTGAITVGVDAANCPAGDGFAISLANLRGDACQALLPRLVGTRAQITARGIVGALAGGASVLTASTVNGVTVYDFNPAAAIADCADGVAVEICFAQN